MSLVSWRKSVLSSKEQSALCKACWRVQIAPSRDRDARIKSIISFENNELACFPAGCGCGTAVASQPVELLDFQILNCRCSDSPSSGRRGGLWDLSAAARTGGSHAQLLSARNSSKSRPVVLPTVVVPGSWHTSTLESGQGLIPGACSGHS